MSRPKSVFVSGNFNVLHPGHLRLLRFARECGDRLIVGVASDRIAGEGAHVPQQLRLEGVESISWVDEAFIFDEAVEAVIGRLRPDVVVKGREYEGRYNVEQAAVDRYGGVLLFSSGEVVFSSIDLIRQEFTLAERPAIRLPRDFMERHGITVEGLAELIRSFAGLRVCVFGDLIVDEYITCQPLGMSQEDPTVVVTPIDSVRFVGGAGIVAGHAAGLGAHTDFVSVTGNDAVRRFARRRLEGMQVRCHLLRDNSRPTTLKQRYRSRGKCLLRVSHLHQSPISSRLQQRMKQRLRRALADCDLLVFSDFNYGCLPQALVDWTIDRAAASGVMMAADSQSSSQIGDIGRFRRMELITPTEAEARISTRNHEDGLVVLAEQLRRRAQARNVLLKLGEEGVLVHACIQSSSEWQTDRIPALNRAPRDVAGAGDSLLIAAAMTLAVGGDIWEAACIGSLAAAIQVGRLGNAPLSTDELHTTLMRHAVVDGDGG
ncbi:MAG: ADP-heptose synthase [Zetaproteobacteria bacterium]|nr:MAG: ADP-heptose synthase [Zetaproteobacteria bacterium]